MPDVAGAAEVAERMAGLAVWDWFGAQGRRAELRAALEALRGADAVLCEDTRVTGALLARHGVSAPMVPLHDHNEDDQTPRALARLRE